MQHEVLLETIRFGKLNHLSELNRETELLADCIRVAADERIVALSFFESAASLHDLAACLPGPLASEFRSARTRLMELAKQFQATHRRAANLVASVRSYFQGVLASLVEAGGTTRYGRTGAWLRS